MKLNRTLETRKKEIEQIKENYKLALEKKRLRDDKDILRLDDKNVYKVKKVKAKNDINILALNGGVIISKICVFLTIVSCILTIAGNVSTFICNIAVPEEDINKYIWIYKKIIETKQQADGSQLDIVTYLRFNFLSTFAYIPLIASLQIILYQISKNLYLIKKQYKQFYAYALMLQFGMLGYSVYSNFQFLAYYIKPETFIQQTMVFIPAFLLDICCIFLLSLSQQMKILAHIDIGENSKILDWLKKKNEIKEDKEKTQGKETIEKKKKPDINPSVNPSISPSASPSINPSASPSISLDKDTEQWLKEEGKKAKNQFLESIGKTKDKANQRDKERETKKASNKLRVPAKKKIENYIEKQSQKGEKKIEVNEMLKKIKVSKNTWGEIKKELITDGKIDKDRNILKTFK